MIVSSQTSFSSGEVSTKFIRRNDTSVSGTTCRSSLNMYPITSGAITRRSGEKFLTYTKHPTNNVRLYDFVFNQTQAIQLEFGNQYVRFHQADGTILSSTVPYEVVTPYLHTDVLQLKATQINDIIILTHPNFQPRKLTRFSNTNWTLTLIDFIDGAYEEINTTATTFSLANVSGLTHTLTASTATFTAAMVGRQVRWEIPSGTNAGQWIWGKITAYTSTTQVTLELAPNQPSFPHNTPTTLWRLGAFYTNNYPALSVFHQNRLVFANTASRPSSGWLSELNSIFEFAPSTTQGTADNIGTANSIFFTLASSVSAAIQFLVSDTALLVGTESGVFASNIDVLTPNNFTMALTVAIPMSSVSPLSVINEVIVVNRLRNKVYAITYNNDARGYTAQDLSIYWSNLFNKRIARMVYCSYPTPLIWFQMDDGSLLSMLYDPTQKLVGVTQHRIAESTVKYISTLPDVAGGFDTLWLLSSMDNVNRIGTLEREYDSEWYQETTAVSARFMDCFKQYSGTPTTSFTGATNLSNKLCSYIADGVAGSLTVSNTGTFTLPTAASNVAIGLPYTSGFTTTDAAISPNANTTELYASSKKVLQVKLGFHDSLYCYIQSQGNTLPTKYQRDTIRASQDIEISQAKTLRNTVSNTQCITNDSSQEVALYIWIDEPLPLMITAIYLDLSVAKF